jgi:hypothetical protein
MRVTEQGEMVHRPGLVEQRETAERAVMVVSAEAQRLVEFKYGMDQLAQQVPSAPAPAPTARLAVMGPTALKLEI